MQKKRLRQGANTTRVFQPFLTRRDYSLKGRRATGHRCTTARDPWGE